MFKVSSATFVDGGLVGPNGDPFGIPGWRTSLYSRTEGKS